MKRWSLVRELNINTVTMASIAHVGDNDTIEPISRVLEVHREGAVFDGREGEFNDYALFAREIPAPEFNETLELAIDNPYDRIQVGRVDVMSASTSGIVQIGTNRRIASESRTKYIRQFFSADAPTGSQIPAPDLPNTQ
ncbi:spore germination protein GerPE [Paenibacillus xerothermodurans]|uniref:Spore germination protein GerPE n=1 Tax=Paenibacillus xerothermodurans TaxID=1977292 RepID=A0A2W1P5G5_PAEXE|nr:spore germination protein GerPE [Paenibacillus xerothermodurans]PZE22368.1 spore germination protein GerPE [Paenibacillus xerothermodurans]